METWERPSAGTGAEHIEGMREQLSELLIELIYRIELDGMSCQNPGTGMDDITTSLKQLNALLNEIAQCGLWDDICVSLGQFGFGSDPAMLTLSMDQCQA